MAQKGKVEDYSNWQVSQFDNKIAIEKGKVNTQDRAIAKLNDKIQQNDYAKSNLDGTYGKEYKDASAKADKLAEQIQQINDKASDKSTKDSYSKKLANDRIDSLKKERAEQVKKMDSSRKQTADSAKQRVYAIDSEIKEAEIKNAASATVSKADQDKVDDLKKQMSKYTSEMDKIKASNAKNRIAASKYNKNILNDQKAIKQLQKIRQEHMGKLNNYKKARNVLVEKQRALTAKKNGDSIANKIAQGGGFDKNNPMVKGYLYMYQADLQSDTMIQMVETDPSESGSINLSTATVDNKLPTASFGTPDVRTLSGTYRLIIGDTQGSSDKSALANQYLQIIHWADNVTEMHIKGFSNWKHCFITSYGKQGEATTSANTLVVSLTFTFVNLSKIETSKKKKGKSTGKKTKKTGRASKNNPDRTKSIKIKAGDTMTSIAQRMHKPLADIIKDNKKLNPKSLPIGGKLVI